MGSQKSRVTLVRTEDRKSGVVSSIKGLNINPIKNKNVLIKPNFNKNNKQLYFSVRNLSTFAFPFNASMC